MVNVFSVLVFVLFMDQERKRKQEEILFLFSISCLFDVVVHQVKINHMICDEKEINYAKVIELSLAEFDSRDINISLLQFARQTVSTHSDDDRTLMRKQAGITSCKLLLRVIDQMRHEMIQLNGNSMYNCGNSVAFMTLADQHGHQSIIKKILAIDIYDGDWQIRELLLCCLDHKLFCNSLGAQECVQSLYISCSHEYFQVRTTPLRLLASSGTYNPIHVMPFLRKLLQFITYLEFARDVKNETESAPLFGSLIESAHERVISPYTHDINILSVLLRVLNIGDNIKVSPTLVDILRVQAADLSENIVGSKSGKTHGAHHHHHHNKIKVNIMSLIESNGDFTDSSKSHTNDNLLFEYENVVLKHCACLQTLCDVISATGYVIGPYVKHKQLLLILNSLRRDSIRSDYSINTTKLIETNVPSLTNTSMKRIYCLFKNERMCSFSAGDCVLAS